MWATSAQGCAAFLQCNQYAIESARSARQEQNSVATDCRLSDEFHQYARLPTPWMTAQQENIARGQRFGHGFSLPAVKFRVEMFNGRNCDWLELSRLSIQKWSENRSAWFVAFSRWLQFWKLVGKHYSR